MSRTNKTSEGSKNPSSKFLEWKSTEKCWAYYDKEAETEVKVPIEKLAFIVLDQLNTVKGFDESAGSGIWSNEVRNCQSDKLVVRNKNKVLGEGTWADVKGIRGVRFTKSVYIMAKLDGGYELCNLQLSGAALSAWFDFCETAGDLYGDVVVGVKSTTEGKKGAVTYNVPVFSVVSRELSDEAAHEADCLDEKLQLYLKDYLSEKGYLSGASVADANAYDKPLEYTLDEDEDPPF